MKTSLNPLTSKPGHVCAIGALTAVTLILTAFAAHAANIEWQGGTASYTNAADWVGGVVPGPADSAINDNGSNNVVQINVGNPDWTLNQILAGDGAGNGAFLQNGQTLTVTNTSRAFRMGIAAADTGVYTLNGGSINYGTGGFNIGEIGTGILNINGGSISGSGNFSDNFGVSSTAITASMDGGTSLAGTTWFEQGFDTGNTAIGLPLPGATITTNFSGTNYSFTMAASYTTNDAVMIDSNLTSATITLTAPTVCSGLSFLGSAGNAVGGTIDLHYTVHHADSTTESGTISFADWFSTNGVIAFGAGGRVNADGSGVADFSPNTFPYLFAVNAALTNTTSAVTSIGLTYLDSPAVNTHAAIMAVSGLTNGAFGPLALTSQSYNENMIVAAGAVIQVSSTVTDIVTQVAGSINVTNGGQMFVGNYGVGIYNLSGGTIDIHNYIAFGRSGGNGTFNMTGGTLNQDGGGNLLVGTGFAAPGGTSPVGVLNQSGGTINSIGQFLVPENSPATGTYNLSGTGSLVVSNWIAVGRSGGNGVLTMNGGSITKAGDNGSHLDFGASAVGIINQTNGVITNLVSDTFVGESGTATWNLEGGSAILGNVIMCVNGGSTATLNLDGGVLQASEIISSTSSSSVSTLNFNGGVLQANSNNASFVTGIFAAKVSPGGAIIDSQGFNIGIPQTLADNGGGTLTKNGTGTLTLTGANTYSGATTVNGGTLTVGTSATGGGGYTVANNQGLGVIVQSANGQLNAASLTTSGSTGATLSFDLDGFGNPTSAPLNVVGTWTASGSYTVNIADKLPQLGQFPLIKYGTLSGSPVFAVGSLPTGVTATIVNDATNNSIDLDITGVNQPRWDGNAGGTWDIGLTTNWVNIGTGLPTFYTEGSPVEFDDNATGTTTVNVTTTVHPASVTETNSVLNYTFVGSGSISGGIGLNKQGTATLNILNNNGYTGPTVISGGTLAVTNLANGGSPSPIGASSASPTNLVLAGGSFSYGGAPTTANRGFEIASTNSVVDAESNFALSGQVAINGLTPDRFLKTGPAQFTLTTVGNNEFGNIANPGILIVAGTLMFDGSAGPQVNHTVNEMWIGGTPASGGSLILSNTTLNVDSWIGVGRGSGTIGNTSSVTMYNSTFHVGNVSLGYANGIAGNFAYQNLTLNGASTLTNNGAMNLCESAGSTATISINGTSLFWGQNAAFLPNGGGATGTVMIANSGRLYVNNGWFSVGNGNAGSGTVMLRDSGSVFISGDFNVTDTGTSVGSISLQDNAVASGNTFLVAKGGGSFATVNMSGGTIIARGGDTQIGGSGTGTMNQTGGALFGTNWISIGRNPGGVGVYNLSGGSLTKVNPNGTRLNVAEAGTGTLNVSGTGSVVVGVGGFADLDICSGAGNGTVNLNGGTITAGQVTHLGSGTATFNFNGGTLAASASANANFMSGLTSAFVRTNGAFIDSGANAIAIGQALLDGTGGGGLTKLGSGALALNGANTYTGPTLVSAGALGGTGTVVSPVTVASGAIIGAGSGSIGTLGISNTLTFSAGSTGFMKVTPSSNDQIAGLTGVSYAGTLVVSNSSTTPLTVGTVYKLFSAAVPGSGNFSSVTLLPAGAATFDPATGNLKITAVPVFEFSRPVFSGGNLILTGTGGVPGGGYTVLSATNLTTPLVNWVTNTTGVFNGSGGFSNSIPVNPADPAQFFRTRIP